MEVLPQIIEDVQVPVTLPVHAYLMDHRLENQVVLPAVEAVHALIAAAKDQYPHVDETRMMHAAFDKFLIIRPDDQYIPAFVSLKTLENHDIVASLHTKAQYGRSPITRTKEHARLRLAREPFDFPESSIDPDAEPRGALLKIPAEKIYPLLIAFGKAYHNIRDVLKVAETGVTACIAAPSGSAKPAAPSLGSPFPLDAAFHAACIWGQRFRHLVPFPVAFEKRMILNPTQPGEQYRCRIHPVGTHAEILVFDVWIYNSTGTIFEFVSGLKMRDVSGGRLKPPKWVIHNQVIESL